jgi:epoxyqueuosine reductase
MSINELIANYTKDKGIDILSFIDISILPNEITRNYENAILIGIALTKDYLRRLSTDSNTDFSEFTQKENIADRLAENIADLLMENGYKSYAQSESNIGNDGLIDGQSLCSVLPHKTIALLSGIGWIGKDNLIVTRKYGSAICFCTVLTNAPIISENKELMLPQCGSCNVCKTACPKQAISGRNWEIGCKRDNLLDINLCKPCLKCLVNCTWTQHYIEN